MKLAPKNWTAFQHYKDRRPPWIKLHRVLLDDRDYQRLPLASRALAPMLWLLASESDDGSFDASLDELTFRLRQPKKDIESGLAPLVEAGLFEVLHDASSLLADCQQHAPQRREETETEGEARQDKPAAPSGRKVTFKTWCEQERAAGRSLISDWQPLLRYMEATKLSDGLVQLAWDKFRSRYTVDPNYATKRYLDWRATFMNALRDNWFKLWCVRDGAYELTTAGQQAQREQAAASEVQT